MPRAPAPPPAPAPAPTTAPKTALKCTKWEILQSVVNFVMPLACGILEMFAILEVTSVHDSICIQAREIHSEAQDFVLLTCTLVIPDLLFCAMVLLDFQSSVRPLSLFYQLCAVALSAWAAFSLKQGLTFCGNPAQNTLDIASNLAIASMVLHLLHFIILMLQMPKTELRRLLPIRKN